MKKSFSHTAHSQITACYTDFNSKVLAIQNGQQGIILQDIGNQMPQKLKSPTWLLTT